MLSFNPYNSLFTSDIPLSGESDLIGTDIANILSEDDEKGKDNDTDTRHRNHGHNRNQGS